ncbi:MAG: hypothetical protein U0841_32720 [Chloroflexia bacterium]
MEQLSLDGQEAEITAARGWRLSRRRPLTTPVLIVLASTPPTWMSIPIPTGRQRRS